MNPQKDEIVICTVKKVLPHSIFLTLDEYPQYEGMLHISELAYKFVKNIHSYAKKGKTMICKVIKVNPEKKQVDLSLRRVKDFERKQKLNEWKLEKRAQKLLEVALKDKVKDYEKIISQIKEDYEGLKVILEDTDVLDDYLDKKILNEVKEFIEKSKTNKKATIKVILELFCLESNGINLIKNFLKKLQDDLLKSGLNTEIKYLGTPKYQMSITVLNNKIKESNKKLIKILREMEDYAKKEKINFLYKIEK